MLGVPCPTPLYMFAYGSSMYCFRGLTLPIFSVEKSCKTLLRPIFCHLSVNLIVFFINYTVFITYKRSRLVLLPVIKWSDIYSQLLVTKLLPISLGAYRAILASPNQYIDAALSRGISAIQDSCLQNIPLC